MAGRSIAPRLLSLGRRFACARTAWKGEETRLEADPLKRVIVQETATWCGPCHMLAHYLERHRALWEQDYVWVRMDERWNGSRDVMNGIKERQRGGIPWFAILDSEGKTLATSDGPDGNIGFPSEPSGIEHFMQMLSSTRQRMSDEQLAELRKDLESKE